ncbi:carbohydrate kinase family protein [Maricaulis maris]|uniref:carbohydrate kinase family protein n=1 Tax=Maricaulis maris TaxID=74318 RepID=UPI003A932EAA
MTPDLVTIGGLTMDHVVAATGEVALSQAGGNGAYSAIGALMWTQTVGLVSLGVASYPVPMLDRLRAAGVDLDGVAFVPERLRAAHWFIYDNAGHRNDRFRSVPEALAEAGFPQDRLSPAQVAAWVAQLEAREAPEEISYSEFRHRNPITPAQVPDDWLKARGVHFAPSRIDVIRTMQDHFAPAGMVMVMDSGWQFDGMTPDEMAPLLARVDAFLPSEVELESLMPGTGMETALERLSALCRGTVAVKLGPKGVLTWDKTAGRAVPVPALKVDTLDPTGAGDSFCGGFLAGLVETGDPVKAACFGAVSASRIVQRFGADGPLPFERGALRALLESHLHCLA